MGKNKTKEAGIPYGAREKMPMWYSVAWSSRGVSMAIHFTLLAQVTFYCTDMLGMNPAIVGAFLLISKVIDAFTDLGIGYLVDRTNTRWGKGRPYELFIIPNWLFTIFMFSAPHLGTVGQYIWVFAMYIIVSAICSTGVGGAEAVYISRAFTTENNRVKTISINGVVVMLFSVIYNIIQPQLLATLGTTRSGWITMSILIGIPMAVIGLIRFIFIKEIDGGDGQTTDTRDQTNEKGETIGFGETVKALFQNKMLLLLTIMMLLSAMWDAMGTINNYYFLYIMGDIGLQSIVGLAVLVTPLALVFFPVLMKKFGSVKILRGFTLLAIIGLVIRTIGGANLLTVMIGAILAGIGCMPLNIMMNIYIIDCMDYGEWKTGIRIEGMLSSVTGFFRKCSGGLASAIMGIVMMITGYEGTAAQQSASATAGIVGLYNIFPLCIFTIIFILSLFYTIDKTRPEMEAALKKKHEAAQS